MSIKQTCIKRPVCGSVAQTGTEQAQANLDSLLEYWFSLYSKKGHTKTRAERRLRGPKSKPGADGPLHFPSLHFSIALLPPFLLLPQLPCSPPPSLFPHPTAPL